MSENPTQPRLWQEHIYMALDSAICAAAPANRNAYESMAERLWPNKAERTRYARLKACLDEQQENTNFTPDELMTILVAEDAAAGKACITFILDQINRHLGEKKTPKSPKTILLEKQAALASEQARVQRKIDRIDNATALKAVGND